MWKNVLDDKLDCLINGNTGVDDLRGFVTSP
jgi:hypothetical protein